MKSFFPAICILSLSLAAFPAAAQDDDEYVAEAVDLQEVASRLNVIKADDYVAMTSPAIRSARRTAASLSEKEAKLLIKSQNDLARRVARRMGQPEPEPIDIDPNDKEALEKLLTPQMYTYDDITVK